MKSLIEYMREYINLSSRLFSSKIKVRHVKGSTNQEVPEGGTWKEYWERQSERNGTYKKFPLYNQNCPCCNILTKPEDFVGAHVERVNNSDKVYICPVCRSCNSKYGEGKEESPVFEVYEWDCVEVKNS